MGNSIEISGTDELLIALRNKLQAGADRVENQGMKAAGEHMAQAMRSKVNLSDINYKHLRDDIKVSRIVRKDGMKYVLIGPSRKTGWRGHFLEYGTSKMAARPFAHPAFKETKGEALMIMADELRKGLKQ
jgi:HK97 gp10 family phage protein